MTTRQFQVTFDCADPKRVALFWCDALGYEVPPPPSGFADWDAFEQTLPPEAQVEVRVHRSPWKRNALA